MVSSISYVNAITQYVLIALDQQKWIAIAFALATAFNLITNIIFVPRYGYAAAATTTVLSELVLLVPFFVVARRQRVSLPLSAPCGGRCLQALACWP